MAYPIFKATSFGVSFIFDQANHVVVTFQNFENVSLGANLYRTLEANGVDYQVPAGRKLMLLGCDQITGGASGNPMEIYQTDAVDVGTGEVLKFKGAYGDTTTKDIIKAWFKEFLSSKYVTIKNVSGQATFYARGFQGLEVPN